MNTELAKKYAELILGRKGSECLKPLKIYLSYLCDGHPIEDIKVFQTGITLIEEAMKSNKELKGLRVLYINLLRTPDLDPDRSAAPGV